MYKNATRSYRDNSLLTNSSAKRVSLAMDICISALKEAADAADKTDIQRRSAANAKAQEVIMYLKSTLDMEAGGEVARNLNQLYLYAQRRLADVDFKNDAAAAREIAELLAPLRDAWEQLHRQNDTKTHPEHGSTGVDDSSQEASALTLTA